MCGACTDKMMRLHVRKQINHAGVYYVFFLCVPFFHHAHCVFQMQRKHAEMQKEQLMVPQTITCLIRTSVTSTSGATYPETQAQNNCVQQAQCSTCNIRTPPTCVQRLMLLPSANKTKDTSFTLLYMCMPTIQLHHEWNAYVRSLH